MYYSIKSTDDFKWKIHPKTTKIGNFMVQRATTSFGGRDWEAWFAKDIPFSEGPYKFRGLPGLILQIKDSKNHYIFNFVESKNLKKDYDTTHFLETLYGGRKPLEISEKQWKKLQLEYFHNPTKDIDLNTFKVIDKDGNPVKLDIKKLTERYQKRLRKNSNVLELDKAVQYPEK